MAGITNNSSSLTALAATITTGSSTTLVHNINTPTLGDIATDAVIGGPCMSWTLPSDTTTTTPARPAEQLCNRYRGCTPFSYSYGLAREDAAECVRRQAAQEAAAITAASSFSSSSTTTTTTTNTTITTNTRRSTRAKRPSLKLREAAAASSSSSSNRRSRYRVTKETPVRTRTGSPSTYIKVEDEDEDEVEVTRGTPQPAGRTQIIWWRFGGVVIRRFRRQLDA